MIYRQQLIRVFLALFSALFLLSGGSVRAQDETERERQLAQQWLLEQLHKPGLVLVNYTYSGSSWTDSSLGCPAPGQTITAGAYNGYSWMFTFDNQVSYEVHSALGGTPAVLCSATSAATEMKLVPYTGPDFVTVTPEAWLVFPTNNEVLFAPNPLASCEVPGMRIVSVGRVASDATPDSLLDEYTAAAGVQDDPAQRLEVGTFGRSTTYQTPCQDQTRTWRITIFIQYGSAHRVEQWAPAAEFDAWNAWFGQILDQFGPPGSTPAGGTVAATPADATDATAEAPAELKLPPLPMAHIFVGDLFVGTLNDLPGRSATTTPDFERYYLNFSPNGLYVSYIDATNGELRIMDAAEGLSPRKIASPVDATFPPAWSPDSQQIAYTAATGQTDANGAPVFQLFSVPVGGGDPQPVSTFALSGTCATTASDPADVVYFHESGPGGQQNVLIWMADGQFLVTTGCAGGLGVLNPSSGQITEFGTDLRGGALSPDRSRFAALTDSGIALLDFTKWERTNLRRGSDARQIAWGADGQTLYYAIEMPSQAVTLDDPAQAERGQQIFGMWPVTLSNDGLSLVRLDLTTVKESVIWQGGGRAIGRIAPAPDGTGLLFSLVPASLPLAELFTGGGDAQALRAAWPDPVLYWLPAGATSPTLVAYSGQPAFAPIALAGQ